MNARQRKLEQTKLNALVAFLDNTTGAMRAESLSRSYGVDIVKVTEILRNRGRYLNG